MAATNPKTYGNPIVGRTNVCNGKQTGTRVFSRASALRETRTVCLTLQLQEIISL